MLKNLRLFGLVPLAALVLSTGCEDEPQVASKPKIKLRETVGKTTQDIRPAAPELEGGGARIATTKITAKDPITIQGNAYVTSVGRLAILEIKHAVDLYQATNGKYPKDFKEFMDEIVKANSIRLPTLPYYQEYGYDEQKHELIILEFHDRKTRFQEQQDKELGRR